MKNKIIICFLIAIASMCMAAVRQPYLGPEGTFKIHGDIKLHEDLSISMFGSNLMAKHTTDESSFFAHSDYLDNLTITDTRVINVYDFQARVIIQADESGEWNGTSYDKASNPPLDVMSEKGYLKIGTTAPTADLIYCVWEGIDDTGMLIFDQRYSKDLFATNTEATLEYYGAIEFHGGTAYFTRLKSADTFSLKADVAGTTRWKAVDKSFVRHDNLLQTIEWVDGATWAIGDYFIDSRRIYTCNVAGVQTGTFVDNAVKWDVVKGAYNILRSNDRYKYMLLANSLLEYWDGSDVRLRVNSASTSLYSPDQTAFIALNDGEFDVWLAIERMSIDATRAHITSPDGIHSLVVDNTGAFYDGVELLTESNPATDRIVSPDTLKDLIVSDLNLLYSDGSYARLFIDGTESRLTSPGGQSTMSIKNGDFNFADGTRDRIEADGIGTTLRSTTGAYLSMLSNTLLINDNTRNRLEIDASVTTLRGPTGADLILADTWLAFNDGTRTRLNISSANAALYSPDGSKYLNITNAASTFIGAMTVNGFTKIGSTAPAIKMKKLTGTTPAVEGNSVTIAHGLTGSKILAVDVLVGYSSNVNNGMPPGYIRATGYEYYVYQTSSGIVVYLSATNSERVLSDTIRILITYEE